MLFRTYLNRYAFPTEWINSPPSQNLGMSIVIPSYNEPDILTTLESLLICHPVNQDVEVIVVINTSDADPEEIQAFSDRQYDHLLEWAETHNRPIFRFCPIRINGIPFKLAGPGYARKVGMDEAVRRFSKTGNKNGVIVSLDADSVVEPNYLKEIERQWANFPKTNGVSIHFEHPLTERERKIRLGIVNYELHLRYYIHAQKFGGFPFAFQTVGSCFAVSVVAYAKQGGMNKRKAGEDFYFLHKIIPLGNFYNLTTTKVYPSPRPSLRVPFGTGKTIADFIKQKGDDFFTYNFQTFRDLRVFLGQRQLFYHITKADSEKLIQMLPAPIQSFLNLAGFINHLERINGNTANPESFDKAFFRWFDAFKLMKFVHFARDNYYPNQEIKAAANTYLSENFNMTGEEMTKEGLLKWFRDNNIKSDRIDS